MPKPNAIWKFMASASNSPPRFSEAFAIDLVDDREEYGEERFVTIGMAKGDVLLFVAYTERENRVRIISPRRATRDEQDDYFKQNA
jgi:uncharacterized protein